MVAGISLLKPPPPFCSDRELRFYQWECCRVLTRALVDGESRLAVISATGSGKSQMINQIVLRAVQSGVIQQICLLTPQRHSKRVFIGSETYGVLGEGLRDGLYASPGWPYKLPSVQEGPDWQEFGDYPTYRDKVERDQTGQRYHTATYAKLFAAVKSRRRQGSRDPIGDVFPKDLTGHLFIFDECQHVAGNDGNLTAKILEVIVQRGGLVLLATATPYRADGYLVLKFEDTTSFIRSMARHAREGYAPNKSRLETVVMEGVSRDSDEDQLTRAARQVVEYWVETGKCHSVIRLPGKRWVPAFMREFGKVTSLYDATDAEGTWNAEKKAEFEDVLQHECDIAQYGHYKDSKFLVFLAIRRFNEATNNPLINTCIHVGSLPGSLTDIVQFAGRGQRDKRSIRGYPADQVGVSNLVFFLYDSTAGSYNDEQNQHHHVKRALLIQAFFDDMSQFGSTAKNSLRTALRSGLDRVNLAPADINMLRSVLNELESIPEERRAELRVILERTAAEYATTHEGKEPTARQLWKGIQNRGWTVQEKLVLGEILVRDFPDTSMGQFAKRSIKRLRLASSNKRKPRGDVVFDLLEESLGELIGEYGDRFKWESGNFLNSVAQFTSSDASEIRAYLSKSVHPTDLSDSDIVDLMQAHWDTHGKVPNKATPGGTVFNGLKFSWSAMSRATYTHPQFSLPTDRIWDLRHEIKNSALLTRVEILQAMVRDKRPAKRAPRHLRVTKAVILVALQECLEGQTMRLFDASAAFGRKGESWVLVELALRRGWRSLPGGQSLQNLSRFFWSDGVPSQGEIEAAVESYRACHGHSPGEAQRVDDVSEHFDAPEGLLVWDDLLAIRRKR